MGHRQDVASSVRLAVSGELRLFAEIGVAVLAYAIWVGLTGAALSFGADAATLSLSPTPWTETNTVVVAVVAVAWLVVPAALAARLLVDLLTNESDNLSQQYRFHHPSALLVPPAALFVAAGVAVVALDPAPWPLLVGLVAVSTFVLVRTVAYSYRVFALSAPRVLQAIVFVAALVLAAALLTGAAVAAGREAFLAAVLSGFGDAVDLAGLGFLVDGRVVVRVGTASAGLPAVVAAAVAATVGLAALYLVVQTVAAGVARLREPDVPRARLRTGQRHPEFARSTTDTKRSGPSSPATSAALDGGSKTGDDDVSAPADTPASGDASASGDTPAEGGSPAAGDAEGDEEMIDEARRTKVYTPPEDTDADSRSGPDGEGGGETGGAAGADEWAGPDETAEMPTEIITDACPACEESLDPDADYGFCPACGEQL
jgi:hypothetical protein